MADAPDPLIAALTEAGGTLAPPRPEDFEWMERALVLARTASEMGEVPVGCVIVGAEGVIAEAHNLRESLQDPTAHAELIALRETARKTGFWRLSGTTVYVTLEPCPMCAGALVNARVDRVVFGALDPKAGATTTLYNIGRDPRLNHRFELVTGVRAPECGSLLTEFFSRIRKRNR